MSVLEIKPVRRCGARVVIGFAGPSGSGKTYSALLLAYGLANGKADKIGFLDTENRRGSLYANIFPQPFLIGDLVAPFSPSRYVEAIEEFSARGVEVLVIDSVTHEWEGPGGCEEIAGKTKFPDWKTAKREHKKFMNALLLSDMHVIVCIRAREKTDFRDTRNPVSLGIQPICEKNFMFEMTASLMMENEGKTQFVMKCPAELRPILGRGNDYINDGDGMALRAWIDGGDVDPLEGLRNRLRLAASRGSESMKAAWLDLGKKEQQALANFKDTLKAQAIAVDEENAARQGDTGEPDPVTDTSGPERDF